MTYELEKLIEESADEREVKRLRDQTAEVEADAAALGVKLRGHVIHGEIIQYYVMLENHRSCRKRNIPCTQVAWLLLDGRIRFLEPYGPVWKQTEDGPTIRTYGELTAEELEIIETQAKEFLSECEPDSEAESDCE